MSYAPIITLELWEEYEKYLEGFEFDRVRQEELKTFNLFMNWLKYKHNK